MKVYCNRWTKHREKKKVFFRYHTYRGGDARCTGAGRSCEFDEKCFGKIRDEDGQLHKEVSLSIIIIILQRRTSVVRLITTKNSLFVEWVSRKKKNRLVHSFVQIMNFQIGKNISTHSIQILNATIKIKHMEMFSFDPEIILQGNEENLERYLD